MSLLLTNCHYYTAAGMSGWPATPSKVWVLGWAKFDGVTGGASRAIVQVSEPTLSGSQEYVSVSVDGGNAPSGGSRTNGFQATTADPGTLYFWQAANQNKWTLLATVFDTSQSAADMRVIFGRAASTAIAATSEIYGVDLNPVIASMSSIFVGRQRDFVRSGSGTDATDGMKLAYVAIGHGQTLTATHVQSAIDGTNPADLPGVFEYWSLADSTAGLVGALRGITLVPTGGSATAAYDGADNPTVNAPTAPPASSQAPRSMQQFMMRQ